MIRNNLFYSINTKIGLTDTPIGVEINRSPCFIII